MPPTVAVVGDALLDVSIAPTEPMRRGGDVPASVRLGPGGQGANLAVRLARLGVPVRLACGLGDDAAGRLLREALEAEGVEIFASAVPATGAVAVVVHDGDRSMFSQRAPFAAGVDLAALVRGAGWLAVSGYVLLEEDAHTVARRCVALDVRRAVLGCDVPGGRIDDWRHAAFAVRPDVLLLNGNEAEALARASEPDSMVIVTRRDGAEASGCGMAVSVAAGGGASPAVDTTGAGDAFAAAAIAAFGDRWPPDEGTVRAALTSGIAAAVRVVTVPGAQASIEGERVASP